MFSSQVAVPKDSKRSPGVPRRSLRTRLFQIVRLWESGLMFMGDSIVGSMDFSRGNGSFKATPLQASFTWYTNRLVPTRDVESRASFAPPLQLSPAKPAAQPTQPLNQTGKWENYRPVPFILNKPFVDEVGYYFWMRLNACRLWRLVGASRHRRLNISQKADGLPLSSGVDAAEPQPSLPPDRVTSRRSKRIQPPISSVAQNPAKTVSTDPSKRAVRSKPERKVASNLTTRSSAKPQGVSKRQPAKTTGGKARKKWTITSPSDDEDQGEKEVWLYL